MKVRKNKEMRYRKIVETEVPNMPSTASWQLLSQEVFCTLPAITNSITLLPTSIPKSKTQPQPNPYALAMTLSFHNKSSMNPASGFQKRRKLGSILKPFQPKLKAQPRLTLQKKVAKMWKKMTLKGILGRLKALTSLQMKK